ncbi:hypothetical protein [Nitrososphaera sp.]|uniref:hypothetical protein n=1 Tax=Nitrososphaera sp. TaxID=1971748 RepID=UPI002EDAEF61
MTCIIHPDFFDDNCEMCRQEYLEMKKAGEPAPAKEKRYKEFTEERAKKLYEEILLQYLKSGLGDAEAAGKAQAVVRKQCDIRGIPHWPWL